MCKANVNDVVDFEVLGTIIVDYNTSAGNVILPSMRGKSPH